MEALSTGLCTVLVNGRYYFSCHVIIISRDLGRACAGGRERGGEKKRTKEAGAAVVREGLPSSDPPENRPVPRARARICSRIRELV